ncbi:glycosyl hydrolase, partial [Xylella fastidiosa subsp. multiplex]|nr:glycosyl hydrolase [Xylella fastidiosa subsp. multiplex]
MSACIRHFRRLAATVTVLVAATLGLSATPAAAPDGPRLVMDRDFADPDVVQVSGTYHAYSTNADGKYIQHATSTDLLHWSMASADALAA